jgi:single-stranded DNA-binding protein
MLNGRLQTRQYVNKAGENRYTTEIISEEVLFLGGKKSEQSQTNEPLMVDNSDGAPF